jgi:hypothetical protein
MRATQLSVALWSKNIMRMKRPVRPLIVLSCILALPLLAGCDDDQIETVAAVKFDALGKASASPAPVAQPSSPISVMGLSQQQVEMLLGPPMERRDMAPAQAWRYRDDRCTLELFFYIDVKSRIFRTLSYDVVSRENDVGAGRRCLAELESQAHPTIVGVSSPAEPQAH